MDNAEFGRLTLVKSRQEAAIKGLEAELQQIGKDIAEACAGLVESPPRTNLDRGVVDQDMGNLWKLIESHTEALREYGDTQKELAEQK